MPPSNIIVVVTSERVPRTGRRPVWKSSGAESRVRTPSAAAGCLHTTHARETVDAGGGVGPPKTQTTARDFGSDDGGGGARSVSDGRSIRILYSVHRREAALRVVFSHTHATNIIYYHILSVWISDNMSVEFYFGGGGETDEIVHIDEWWDIGKKLKKSNENYWKSYCTKTVAQMRINNYYVQQERFRETTKKNNSKYLYDNNL